MTTTRPTLPALPALPAPTPGAVPTDPRIPRLYPLLKRVRLDVTALRTKSGTVVWTREPLTPALLSVHLGTERSRGVALMLPGTDTVRAAVLDLDDHDGAVGWERVSYAAGLLADVLLDMGLSSVAFRSGGGKGIHLWILWDVPQDAYSVRKALAEAVDAAGLSVGTGGLDAAGGGEVEVFPKQNRVPVDGHGNMVFLPLGRASVPLMRSGAGFDAIGSDYPFAWELAEPVAVLARPESEPVAGEGGSTARVSLAELASALAAIPNDGDGLPYDKWVRIIFAIHHASDGGPEGLALAEVFSMRSWKADLEFLRSRVWPFVRSDRGGDGAAVVTAGTVLALARAEGWTVPAELEFEVVDEAASAAEAAVVREAAGGPVAVSSVLSAEEQWATRIERAEVDELRGRIVEGVRADRRLTRLSREILAQAWQGRLKVLGVTVGIGTARAEMDPRDTAGGAGAGAGGLRGAVACPDWLEGWVYVQQDDVFFNIERKRSLTTKAFNLTYAFDVAATPGGEDTAPVDYACRVVNVDKVSRVLYMPAFTDRFTMDGEAFVNAYNPSLLPALPAGCVNGSGGVNGVTDVSLGRGLAVMDRGAVDAIATVKGHLGWLLENPADCELLLDWLAWQVQRPGEKVRWAPLICGQEGDGKSALKDLLDRVCGGPNVRVISSVQLKSNFTDWAHGAAVGVVEEVYIPGHNRHEAVNTLKPLITNSVIEIHPKGRKPFNVPNTMNYLLLTNHDDALPLEQGSRRYFVLQSRYNTPELLRAALRADPDYFDRFYDALDRWPGVLRAWLCAHRFSEGFNPNREAPRTVYLERMIELSAPEEQVVLEDILADGTVSYVTPDVLSGQHLTDELLRRGVAGRRGRALSKALRAAGFIRMDEVCRMRGVVGSVANNQKDRNRIRVDGQRMRIWVSSACVGEVDMPDFTGWVQRKISVLKSEENTDGFSAELNEFTSDGDSEKRRGQEVGRAKKEVGSTFEGKSEDSAWLL